MGPRSQVLHLDVGRRWNAPQWELISWRPPPHLDGSPRIEIVGGVGEYGGGKSAAGAARFLSVCLQNPSDDPDRPLRSGIIGPTIASLEQSALAELRAVMRPELVLDERLYGTHWDITLINGHVIHLYSVKGALDGPSLAQIWADEIQKPGYAVSGVWKNIQARVRDRRAKRLNVQATGIARHGLPERLFRGRQAINRKTVMFRTADNAHNLAAGVSDELFDSLPSTELVTDSEGWQQPLDACWPHLDGANYACAPDLAARRDRPTHLGVDLRTHAAIVFAQDEEVVVRRQSGATAREKGLLIVDQWMPDSLSAEAIVKAIREDKARDGSRRWPWRVGEGSTIAMDPTLSQDEIMAFRRGFPGARIYQATSGPMHEAAAGRRCVARAVKDAVGNRRLLLHPSLLGRHERGVPESIRLYSEARLKDNLYEHAADAVRYLVVARLPIPDFSYSGLTLNPDEGLRSALR